MSSIPVTLTIAGSDSSGGAGIQADIKAMQANGTFATSIVTAITAQNTIAVTAACDLEVSLIEAQFDAVLSDIEVSAAKTGMLSSSAIIVAVAAKVREYRIGPLVVDPVMISKSGFALLKNDAIEVLVSELLPLATLCTPNAHEAARLVGYEILSEPLARAAAKDIFEMGPKAVLVKGGHLDEEKDAVDVLFDGRDFHTFRSERIETQNTHGTGCTYAASIAANLAKNQPLLEAIQNAKLYVTEAIKGGFSIGRGHGPTDHFYFLRD